MTLLPQGRPVLVEAVVQVGAVEVGVVVVVEVGQHHSVVVGLEGAEVGPVGLWRNARVVGVEEAGGGGVPRRGLLWLGVEVEGVHPMCQVWRVAVEEGQK